MIDRGIRQRRAIILAAGLALCAVPARAAEVKSGSAISPDGALPPPDAASSVTSKLVDPANGGVAGTGLGKMPPRDPSAAGTGMSVKGPAGVGVDLGPPNAMPKPATVE